MTEVWPDRLPLPTIEGYGIQPGEAILRTEMEAGPARQRRRFTDVPSRITVRWVMRAEQFLLFEAWYRWAAAEGGAWFEIDLLGGLGLLPQEARFTRQFEARPHRGRLWEVTSELEVRARPTLSDGASRWRSMRMYRASSEVSIRCTPSFTRPCPVRTSGEAARCSISFFGPTICFFGSTICRMSDGGTNVPGDPIEQH